MSPSRRLPAGIRGRGSVFTYTWRDHAGRQFSRKAGDTLEEAEAFKRRIDDQLALGEYRPASTTTFGAYAQDWADVWPLKDQTRDRYRGILRRELLPVFGPLQLAKIHPHQVRTWVAGQVAGPLSASSVRQHIAVLRSCLKAAQIDGHLETLPLLGVKMPRSHSRQPAVLTLGEAFGMVEAAPAPWRCAIATALFTGLRLGELLALTRQDVDLPGRRLHVRATLTEVNGRTPRLRREEPKSRAGVRQAPIVEALAVRLQTHLDAVGPSDDGAVFASPVGTWMSKSNFYRDAWKPTRTAAGREDLTFHDLRHTAASLLLAHSGAELAELKFVLGHSQIAHTVDPHATSSPAAWRACGRPSTPLSQQRRSRSSGPHARRTRRRVRGFDWCPEAARACVGVPAPRGRRTGRTLTETSREVHRTLTVGCGRVPQGPGGDGGHGILPGDGHVAARWRPEKCPLTGQSALNSTACSRNLCRVLAWTAHQDPSSGATAQDQGVHRSGSTLQGRRFADGFFKPAGA